MKLSKGLLTTVLKAANRQIKASKQKLNQPAKGIVILVNDWAYGMDASLALVLIERCLMASFSGIDAVLYIAINVLAELPASRRPGITWQPIFRSKDHGINSEFFKKLFEALRLNPRD